MTFDASSGDVGVQTLLERLVAVEAQQATLRERLEETEQGRRNAEARDRQVSEALNQSQLTLDKLQHHLTTADRAIRWEREARLLRDQVRELRVKLRSNKRTS